MAPQREERGGDQARRCYADPPDADLAEQHRARKQHDDDQDERQERHGRFLIRLASSGAFRKPESFRKKKLSLRYVEIRGLF